jgi:hypothetical protein
MVLVPTWMNDTLTADSTEFLRCMNLAGKESLSNMKGDSIETELAVVEFTVLMYEAKQLGFEDSIEFQELIGAASGKNSPAIQQHVRTSI